MTHGPEIARVKINIFTNVKVKSHFQRSIKPLKFLYIKQRVLYLMIRLSLVINKALNLAFHKKGHLISVYS